MGTKITDFPSVDTITFGEIDDGTIFKSLTNDFYYIKFRQDVKDERGIIFNAVRLDDGVLAYVSNHYPVLPVSEVTMHYAEH